MKTLLILLTLICSQTFAQTNFKFDKRFVESEDRWVMFPMEKDSSYIYGFIYIDEQAGLTLNYEGRFKVMSNGRFSSEKLDSTSLKIRLQPNNVKVAFIPEDKYEDLKITATPDWLKYYKIDTNSVKRLYHWGFMYNGWDMCAKALTYLERAQKIDPDYNGLGVELAFSYNCLEQYDKAIAALKNVIKDNSKDPYPYKELVFALVKSGDLEQAAKICTKAIAVCEDQTYNGEMCYNLLHEYFIKKDKTNFDQWLPVAKKWTAGTPDLINSVNKMEKAFGN